jgi:hypothetical protein
MLQGPLKASDGSWEITSGFLSDTTSFNVNQILCQHSIMELQKISLML